MTIQGLLAGVLCAGFALAGCQPPTPTALGDEDLTAIDASTRAFAKAANARDWAGVAAAYTDDAVLLPPNAPAVKGRIAIRAFFESFPPMRDMVLTNVEITGCGDLAFVHGTYTMSIVLDGEEPIAESGHYLEVRRKHADGAWLIHRDMFNSDVPAQP